MQDFFSQSQTNTFPPSPENLQMNFNAPIVNDTIHELDEGFYVVMEVEYDSAVDNANFEQDPGSRVALVIIDDNDGMH